MVPKKEEEPVQKVDWQKEGAGDILRDVDLEQQVRNELEQKQRQKAQDLEKEKDKEKVLSFSERVRLNMAGHSVKQKNVLTADEDEFVSLDITEEEYKKI